MSADWTQFWKEDWDQTRERFAAWWRHDGLIVNVLARRDAAPGKVINTRPLSTCFPA
jgi:hypothetical protein